MTSAEAKPTDDLGLAGFSEESRRRIMRELKDLLGSRLFAVHRAMNVPPLYWRSVHDAVETVGLEQTRVSAACDAPCSSIADETFQAYKTAMASAARVLLDARHPLHVRFARAAESAITAAKMRSA